MDSETQPEPVAGGVHVNQGPHYFAQPDSIFDLSKVEPHQCMTDMVQVGNYLHCNTGHHGMRIPAGMVVNCHDGQWVLEEMVVHDVDKRGKLLKKKT